MLRKLTERVHSEEKGFTLIELLVVILIIGILAAIAIPAFLGQRSKAQDSSAKSMVRNGASAAEAVATDDNGVYTNLTIGKMQTVEPSLNDTGSVTTVAELGTIGANTYTVRARSKSGTWFALTKTNGNTFRCSAPTTAPATCTTSDW